MFHAVRAWFRTLIFRGLEKAGHVFFVDMNILRKPLIFDRL
jgi:hypothetical protein